jgi:hypothetical protein
MKDPITAEYAAKINSGIDNGILDEYDPDIASEIIAIVNGKGLYDGSNDPLRAIPFTEDKPQVSSDDSTTSKTEARDTAEAIANDLTGADSCVELCRRAGLYTVYDEAAHKGIAGFNADAFASKQARIAKARRYHGIENACLDVDGNLRSVRKDGKPRRKRVASRVRA